MKKFEAGDNLTDIADYARNWFSENNVECPKQASLWAKKTVANKELPPGFSYGTLRKKCSIRDLIKLIENPTYISDGKYKHNSINKNNSKNILGLEILTTEIIKGHKKHNIKCLNCLKISTIDYGTMKRMEKRKDKYCHNCRNVGGKPKNKEMYEQDGFTIKKLVTDKVIYKCNKCHTEIERGMQHAKTTEYIVCENCNPRNTGAKIATEFGVFDSTIEYLAYKTILKYLPNNYIERQAKYDTLFNTKTKHTADFFIPILDNLVLEITTNNNNISKKYKETVKWKLQFPNVKFAYSIKEVEDIVRPLVKAKGLTVRHSRDVLRFGIEW